MESDRLLQDETVSVDNFSESSGLINGIESQIIHKNSVESTQSGEKCPHHKAVVTRVYKLRWYILIVFSSAATLQSAAWNTWGPIAQSAKTAYNWTNPLLDLVINCGNVGVLLGLVPVTLLVNHKGIRPSVLLCTLSLGLGCGIRLISLQPRIATILIGAGQFLVGFAGSVTTVLPSVISETWFPVDERTTATAVGIISNAIGGIVTFLLGPNIVSQPHLNRPSDITNVTPSNCTGIGAVRDEIRLLLLIEFIWGALLFVVTVLYFPTKPALPPSQTAGIKRLAFGKAFRGIFRNLGVIQASLMCALPWACYGNWLGLVDIIFHNVGITQTEAGWYGFYACTSGTVAGLIICRIIDKLRRQHKCVLLLLFTSALISIVFITAITNKYVKASHVWGAVAISLLSASLNSAWPVLYEVACEMAYPAGEEMIGLFIGVAKNATAVVFLLAGIVQNSGIQWMNWTVLAVIAVSLPVLAAIRIQYTRIDADSDNTNRDKQHIQSDS